MMPQVVRPMLVAGAALALAMPAAIGAQVTSKPVRRGGVPSLSSYLQSYSPNAVDCSLVAPGGIGANISTSVLGCVWPIGTSNGYVFNSGLEFAGIIGADGGPWAGDTTGAFIYDMKGTTEHGAVLEGIFDSHDSGDTRRWPTYARIAGGAEGAIYHPGLRGQLRASDRDVWWLSWEGQASLQNGRRHPLGVVFETRGLGWNAPVGNESIMYWVFTLYNVTASDPAVYASLRPEIQPVLVRQALEFRRQASDAFGVTLPSAGYTITSLHTALAADFDVGNAGSNFSSINVPLSLGFSWQHDFARETSWQFDPRLFGAPLFSGTGFVGAKILRAPEGGEENRSFITPTSGGSFPAPSDIFRLYRYLVGSTLGTAGDPQCTINNPAITRICFINTGVPSDTKSMLTAGPATLAPGGSLSFVVAYIFAAPAGGCAAPCAVGPGNPLAVSDAAGLLSVGANTVDSLTGYAGFTDWNGDGVVQGDELATVPRSLLAKAQLAQAFFDSGFLTPAAPESPDFYLIPGSSSVTVLWRPSITEASGDPYFAVAGNPLRLGVPNALFDPNYREFDVEGYRIYRGRTDRPGELTLLAQFDYQGTVIGDFTGQVQPTALCAPELGVQSGCPVSFDPPVAGQAPRAKVDIPLVGSIVQVRTGDRIILTDGSSLVLRADTAGAVSGPRCLCDTGVPFVYHDSTVRNSFRYFYSVTAFDLNSWQSGPTSLESPRILKSVTPSTPATNATIAGVVAVAVYGRGVKMDSVIATDPVLDATTGMFSGSARPANGLSTTLMGELIPQLFATGGTARIRLDSAIMGEPNASGCCSLMDQSDPIQRFFTIFTDTDTLSVSLAASSDYSEVATAATQFDAAHPDSVAAARYGLPGSVAIRASLDQLVPPVIHVGAWGSACGLNTFSLLPPNFTSICFFNGPRWFDGPSLPRNPALSRNETVADPAGANCQVSGFSPFCNTPGLYGNAGQVTGAATVYVPQAYTQINRRWRNFEFDLGTVTRAADFNVYWAAGGLIDSVIDATHNVPVRFSPRAGSTWGILNADNPGLSASHDARAELTAADLGCVEPLRSLGNPALIYPCATTAQFESVARLGPLALFQNADTLDRVAPTRATPGFLLYVAGVPTIFELNALPAAGAVWTLRSYSGRIWGGQGAGALNTPEPYQFVGGVRPFTAEGAELRLTYQVTNRVPIAANKDLRRVHTVPDPFYFRSGYDENQSIRFVNLPDRAIIRIYSTSGVLVRVLEHQSTELSGEALWDLTNRGGQRVASGVYFYHVEAAAARRTGRLTVVNQSP